MKGETDGGPTLLYESCLLAAVWGSTEAASAQMSFCVREVLVLPPAMRNKN